MRLLTGFFLFTVFVVLLVGCTVPDENSSSSGSIQAAESGDGGESSVLPEADAVSGAVVSDKVFSLLEFRRHDSLTDCWIVIRNEVFDITGLLAENPDSVFGQLCGQVSDPGMPSDFVPSENPGRGTGPNRNFAPSDRNFLPPFDQNHFGPFGSGFFPSTGEPDSLRKYYIGIISE